MSISEFKKKIIEMKTLIDEDDDLEEKKDNSLFIDANQIMDDYHIDCSFWWDEHYENPSFEEHLATIKDQITLLSCVKRNRKRKSDGTYRIEIPTEYDEENVNFVLEGFQKLAEILENYKRICDRLKIIEALRSKLSEELDEMNKVFEKNLKKRIEAEGLMKNVTKLSVIYGSDERWRNKLDRFYVGYDYVYSEHGKELAVTVHINKNINVKLEYDGQFDFIFAYKDIGDKRDHMNLRNFINSVATPENWFRLE